MAKSTISASRNIPFASGGEKYFILVFKAKTNETKKLLAKNLKKVKKGRAETDLKWPRVIKKYRSHGENFFPLSFFALLD